MQHVIQASVTSKGQVTIPKKVREAMDIEKNDKVRFVYDEDKKTTQIEVVHDILDLVGKYTKKMRGKDLLQARNNFEKNYSRI